MYNDLKPKKSYYLKANKKVDKQPMLKIIISYIVKWFLWLFLSHVLHT